MAADTGLSLTVDSDAEYLRAVESSTCLLLAASPSPTPTLPHPLANVALFSADDGCSGQLHPEDAAADSSSSGDSGSVALRHDPVSAQLINNISMLEYRTLSKGGAQATDNAECKLNGSMSASNGALPKLVEWNWVLVRRVLLWVVVSALAAITAVVVAMIATLPKTCDPQLPWYQGTLFYEVFTASFENSNNDAYGDLRGLTNKLDYIQDLGASAVRLNYIFETKEYPEHYTEVTDMTTIARKIGSMKDFDDLVTEVHKRNMSIVLDIPVTSMTAESNVTLVDPLAHALAFWSSAHKVDGFYIKGLENFTSDPHFESSLRRWKRAVGYGKILMASYETFLRTSGSARNVLLSKMDLIDVHLNVGDGESLKKQINEVLNGPLFSKPSYPWVHWNVGDVQSERLASKSQSDALGLTLLSLSLPGTASIFYGDEIALHGLADNSESDFPERHLVHGLVAMRWENSKAEDGSCKVSAGSELPWNCGSEEPDYALLSTVKSAVELKKKTPTLYTSWTHSDNEWRGNAELRNSTAVVLERWLPRRHSYIYVGNPASGRLSTDLSAAFYAGMVVAATNATSIGTHVYFDQILLRPHEAMIVQLEK